MYSNNPIGTESWWKYGIDWSIFHSERKSFVSERDFSRLSAVNEILEQREPLGFLLSKWTENSNELFDLLWWRNLSEMCPFSVSFRLTTFLKGFKSAAVLKFDIN